MFRTTTISFFLTLGLFLLTNCTIEEEYTLKERLTGKWAFSGRTAFLNDGSSVRSLPENVCEFETEFILREDGTLNYKDFREKEINDGSVDFCEDNPLTREEGVWSISSSDKLILKLRNNQDESDIIIAPFYIEVMSKDELQIRYNEFENDEDEMISYYVYHYFRIYR